MLQDDRAVRVNDKPDIEEPIGPVLVTRLRLCHDEYAPAPREPPEAVGFGARNIDRAGAGEFGMIDVENLVVEPLKRALGYGDKANGDVETGQPERCLG